MSEGPRLTVCVCVKDGARTLGGLLERLLPQAEAAGVKVHVVDHASSDDTAAILHAYAARYGAALKIFPFVEPGLARARNFAWRSASTPWVAFLDADCEPAPDWLAGVLGAIAAAPGPRVGAIGGANFLPREGRFYPACALMLNAWVGGHGAVLNRPAAGAASVDHVPSLNVVYLRAALDSVRGFDDRYLRVGEDVDLSLRLAADGWELRFDPAFTVVHRCREGFAPWLRNMYLYGQGRALLLRAHPERREPKFYAPLLVLAVVVGSGFLLVPAYLAAVFLALLPANGARVLTPTGARATLLTAGTHLAYALGMLHQWARNPLQFPREAP